MEGRSELPLHPLINGRYSPRAFSDRAVTGDELNLLLEAARWAPSSMNEQPWRFLVVRHGGEGHERMLDAMSASNRLWAEKAPVLILNMTHLSHARNGTPNAHAWHDLGLAVAQLTLQATSMGIGLHQLAGIDPERARHSFSIPEEFAIVSMLVIGFHGEPGSLPEHLRERELRRTPRRPLSELAHFGVFDPQ